MVYLAYEWTYFSATVCQYKINFDLSVLKFIYSEKATKFCEISTVDLSYVVPVKSTVEISQNFVSEYMNFMPLTCTTYIKAMKSSPLLGPFCGSEFWGFSLLKIRRWVVIYFLVWRTHICTSKIVPHAPAHAPRFFGDRTRTRTFFIKFRKKSSQLNHFMNLSFTSNTF